MRTYCRASGTTRDPPVLGLRPQRRLVRALGGLVALQRLPRVDVAERGMAGDETPCGLDAEPLGEDRAQRLDLHLAEPRQLLDPVAQVVRVTRLGPEPLRPAAVAVLDEGRQLLDARRHRPRKPVNR